MLFTNSELLGSDNLYALALSSDKSRVAYISYWYCDAQNVLCDDCNFISALCNTRDYVPDKDISHVDIKFIFDNKDKITSIGNGVQKILIGDTFYYLIKVYACMHGLVRLSLSPYSDKWDSGIGGFLLIKENDSLIENVLSRAHLFIESLELYMNGNVFRVDVFDKDNQEDVVDCTIDIIEPSRICAYLNDIGFPCKEEDIHLSYDVSYKIKAVYTLEV